MMLMKSIAQESAPHRIRVNSIAPGAIRTPDQRRGLEGQRGLRCTDKAGTLPPHR
jgi:glucose 1-dehydrogenase